MTQLNTDSGGRTPIENEIHELTEGQAKFVLQASFIAGHLPLYWLEQGIKLARMVKDD